MGNKIKHMQPTVPEIKWEKAKFLEQTHFILAIKVWKFLFWLPCFKLRLYCKNKIADSIIKNNLLIGFASAVITAKEEWVEQIINYNNYKYIKIK